MISDGPLTLTPPEGIIVVGPTVIVFGKGHGRLSAASECNTDVATTTNSPTRKTDFSNSWGEFWVNHVKFSHVVKHKLMLPLPAELSRGIGGLLLFETVSQAERGPL